MRSSDFPKFAQNMQSKAGVNFQTLTLLLCLPAASTSASSQQSSLLPQVSSLNPTVGNSLAVQWLGLCAFTAEGLGSIPGEGTKIPQATWCGQK